MAWLNRNGRESEGNRLTGLSGGINMFLLFNNNWSLFADAGSQFIRGRDYYEPRVEGLYFRTPASYWGSINFTTNYNKRISFDFGTRTSQSPALRYTAYGYYVNPHMRISDKWSVQFNHNWDKSKKIGRAHV